MSTFLYGLSSARLRRKNRKNLRLHFRDNRIQMTSVSQGERDNSQLCHSRRSVAGSFMPLAKCEFGTRRRERRLVTLNCADHGK